MIRRIPIIPTILVLAAMATMIALGFWQLQRREEKARLRERYQAAAASDAPVPFPRDDAQAKETLYRRSTLDCASVSKISAMSGRNAADEPGWAITARCGNAGGALVILGWSREPVTPDWRGGVVSGVIASGPRLVADPPQAGLEANAHPDPADIPDNHLAYAIQWFFFAASAGVIYVLALRKRQRG